MTKKEMILEMIDGLKFASVDRVVENCMKATKSRIDEDYTYFIQNFNNTPEDINLRRFCIALLNR